MDSDLIDMKRRIRSDLGCVEISLLVYLAGVVVVAFIYLRKSQKSIIAVKDSILLR